MIDDPKSLISREGRDILNRHGHAIGAVGDARRQANENQRGYGEHRATAGHSIDEPRSESAGDEQCDIKKRHEK